MRAGALSLVIAVQGLLERVLRNWEFQLFAPLGANEDDFAGVALVEFVFVDENTQTLSLPAQARPSSSLPLQSILAAPRSLPQIHLN